MILNSAINSFIKFTRITRVNNIFTVKTNILYYNVTNDETNIARKNLIKYYNHKDYSIHVPLEIQKNRLHL